MEGETAGYNGQAGALLGTGPCDGAGVAGGISVGTAPNRRPDRLHQALLGLDLAVPDHTTVSCRDETLQVPRPCCRHNGEPLHLLVDSTGLKLCGAGEWLHERHGTKTRRDWRTLHLGTNADRGEIVVSTLTGSTADIEPTQRDQHIDLLAERGRMGWQAASDYDWRALVEADVSYFRRVIGDGLRSRTDRCRATEVAVAVRVLNRMLDLGLPEYVHTT